MDVITDKQETSPKYRISDARREQMDRISRIAALMQFQSRMPAVPFLPKDEAYKQVGCDPRAAMFIFAH